MDKQKYHLRIASYNSTGLNQMKIEYIRHFLDINKVDILLLQETWLVPRNLQKLGDIHKDYMFHGISGINDNEILKGRPYGGIAILWHNSLSCDIKKVCIASKRLCGIVIKGQYNLLLLNCYMPCDNGSKSYVNEEFMQTCDTMELTVARHLAHQVLIGGDMNADFSRGNAQDSYLKDLIIRQNMQCVWDINRSDCRYTFADFSNDRYSCIDHFMVSDQISRLVNDSFVYIDGSNMSNHCPIVLDLMYNITQTAKEEPVKINNRRIAWHKIQDNDPCITAYQECVKHMIMKMKQRTVYSCNNLLCENMKHKLDLNEWCSDLIDICLAADFVLPQVKKGNYKTMPGWCEEVQPYKLESLFWCNEWKAHGKPMSGTAYDNMKDSKRQYLYAVRRLKRKQGLLRNKKFAEALCENRTRDFFKEIRKMNPKPVLSNGINGKMDAKEIAGEFANKYRTLYNSVPSDIYIMDNIREYVNEKMRCCANDDATISLSDVSEAVKHLKMDKGDGDRGLFSNHIYLAGMDFHMQLACMFSRMLTHGHQPAPLAGATVSSIPKDYKQDLTSDSNYRGIAVSSAIGKVMDLIFLKRNYAILCTSESQFAFKSKLSTTMCTMLMKDIIHYYNKNKSTVYACSVDATKAFDRIRHDKLFEVLTKRKMSAVDLRMLMDQYRSQQMRATWKGTFSDYFPVQNGIRQGGIASPVLFCVYFDELLQRLQEQGIGCWLGNIFYGTFCYADDLVMLSPSFNGLQMMVNVCELFGQEFGVVFNPRKSACIAFSKWRVTMKLKITLMGEQIEWCDKLNHLGNIVNAHMTEVDEIKKKKGDLISRTNLLTVGLYGVPDEIKIRVFHSQCCSFYGSQAWNFRDQNVAGFHKMYNRCVRRILGLPYTTHTRYLPHISGYALSTIQIRNMFKTMTMSMVNSQNTKVKYAVDMLLENAQTIIGSNMLHCKETIANDTNLTLQEQGTIQAIKELRRKDFDFSPIFTRDEQNDFLNFLCIN